MVSVAGMRTDTPVGADKTSTANVYAHTRSHGFGNEVMKRILLGTYALTAEYVPHSNANANANADGTIQCFR